MTLEDIQAVFEREHTVEAVAIHMQKQFCAGCGDILPENPNYFTAMLQQWDEIYVQFLANNEIVGREHDFFMALDAVCPVMKVLKAMYFLQSFAEEKLQAPQTPFQPGEFTHFSNN